MNAIRLENQTSPDIAIDKLIAQYGFRPILKAVLAFPIRRKQAERLDQLSNHLRRDIGLDPLPPQSGTKWDMF